ncbi:unnamed protein product, partial [Cochlearia groenlandica]
EHKALDNLLHDIVEGVMDPKQWDAVESKGNKRKATNGVMKALTQLSSKLDTMDINLGGIIDMIVLKVEGETYHIDVKFGKLEGEVAALKKIPIAKEEKQPSADGDDVGYLGGKKEKMVSKETLGTPKNGV